MTALKPRRQKEINHDRVTLYEDKQIGNGAYGKVCKASCGQLPCAAKLLHPLLFQYGDPNSKLLSKFEQECEMLSMFKHPCIVQYLATYAHPDTGQPVLLMELMDESLTRFLERSKNPVPFHIQVNIAHDIVLALDYLHSNGVIHRDLTGNNVLLVGGCRAKVTDFGMLKMVDSQREFNPTMKQRTLCPGCPAYMPPEAFKLPLQYSEKIDIFAFGVIVIQIITRRFPEPSDTTRGTEVERRRADISLIDTDHPLRQTALNCLKDRSDRRPKASELCRFVKHVKESRKYLDSLHYNPVEEVEQLKLDLDVAVRRKNELSEELETAKAEIQRLRNLNSTPNLRAASPQPPLRNGHGFPLHASPPQPRSGIQVPKLQAQSARNRTPSPPMAAAANRKSENDLRSSPDRQTGWHSVNIEYVEVEDDDELTESLNDEDKKTLELKAPPSTNWYHGRINRDIASVRLQAVGRPGAYLVRNSESEPGHFVLSFLDRQLRVFNYKINSKNGHYNAMGQSKKWFFSLEQLIGYYSKFSTVKQNQHLNIPVAPPEVGGSFPNLIRPTSGAAFPPRFHTPIRVA